MLPNLARLGIKKADPNERAKRRLVMSIKGMDKSGKTTLALTAPGPYGLLDLDTGLEGVLEKFVDKREIYPVHYHKVTGQTDATSLLDKMKRDFTAFVSEPKIRSIIVDTGTEMWEVARLARLGKLTQVMPHHYTVVNDEMRKMLRAVYETDKNLILIHKMTEEYVNNQPTGKYKFAGFKEIPYFVQMNVWTWRDNENGFNCTVENCRQNSSIDGLTLEGDSINFQTIATMVFPDTEEGYWL